MSKTSYDIKPIGVIRSELTSRHSAPRQGNKGAPDAWVEIAPLIIDAFEGITAGCDIILITWLHKANREILKVHPRGDKSKPVTGVFSTRSPDRPNPVGLHRVSVLEITQDKIKVGPLEAIDGTPVIDIKPVLNHSVDS
ncbi:MAG: tRNA (N6-threonylcarbamoyladenosine(37)-N6)-methyltransferase TrmO [Deltaproteobacteria bacterium]|nr:tRNA (N6-threonylcarbamoyladenosine(37)-N6)-methyltransferase TrmO [Deltaproteobacteria bacterium]